MGRETRSTAWLRRRSWARHQIAPAEPWGAAETAWARADWKALVMRTSSAQGRQAARWTRSSGEAAWGQWPSARSWATSFSREQGRRVMGGSLRRFQGIEDWGFRGE